MSDRQRIRNPKENFTILPNIYDNVDLTVYEFRLLIHYRRVGNCYESLRTTAKKCHMGKSTVVRARNSLAGKGWIKLEESKKGTIQVEVVDKWTAKPLYVGGTSKDVPQRDSKETVPQEDSTSQVGTECPRDSHEEVLIKKDSLISIKDSRSKTKRTSNDSVRKALEEQFIESTRLRAPPMNTVKQKKAAGELWWNPLREIADLTEWNINNGQYLIIRTVNQMRKDKLTISSPKSIVNVAKSIVAEGTGQSMSGAREFLDELRR